jgi:hypothetical protein
VKLAKSIGMKPVARKPAIIMHRMWGGTGFRFG